jgi:hypothetical protein
MKSHQTTQTANAAMRNTAVRVTHSHAGSRGMRIPLELSVGAHPS